jgi:hypothetical protein
MTTTSSHPSSTYVKRKQDDEEEDNAHMHQQVSSTPTPENTIEEAWELCLSGRLLADLLKAKSLCELSTCARNFLDFRMQIRKLRVILSKGLLKAMESGDLAELTELRLRGEVHFANMDLPLLGPAFRGVRNLQVFHLTRCNLETATTVLAEGLTLTARAKLKALRVDVIAEVTNIYYPPVYFKGFTNLSSLCLQFDQFWFGRRLPLLRALYEGEFPALKYLLLMSMNRLGDEIPRLVNSLRQGSLRQVKHFRIVNDPLDDFLHRSLPRSDAPSQAPGLIWQRFFARGQKAVENSRTGVFQPAFGGVVDEIGDGVLKICNM